MKVWVTDGRQKRLIGRAEITDAGQDTHVETLFGPTSIITEVFAIEAVKGIGPDGRIFIERGVVLQAEQCAEILPGWSSLGS